MSERHNSQLLFIYPEEPDKSFFYEYEGINSSLKETTVGDLIEMIKEEKGFYVDITDVFGRRVPTDSTEENFKALQPFYIKKMIPALINLHIALPVNGSKVTCQVDPKTRLTSIKRLIEEITQIPVGLQEYFIGNRRLSDHVRLIDQQISQKDVEIRLSKTSYEIQIFVKTLAGNTLTLLTSKQDRIESLMAQIEEKDGLAVDQQRLTFAGQKLEKERTLDSYNIQAQSTLNLVLQLKGGTSGVKFVDITQDDKARRLNWSNLAPAWRLARPGLCLQGKCENSKCEAFGNQVIMNKGMGTYDVVYDEHKNKCPMCFEYVQAEKCAFNNCQYGYTGIKVGQKGLPPQKVTSQEEIGVGDYFKLFDPEVIGKATWLTLKILTKAFDERNAQSGLMCGICRMKVRAADGVRIGCDHIYHDECLKKMKKAIFSSCSLCHL